MPWKECQVMDERLRFVATPTERSEEVALPVPPKSSITHHSVTIACGRKTTSRGDRTVCYRPVVNVRARSRAAWMYRSASSCSRNRAVTSLRLASVTAVTRASPLA